MVGVLGFELRISQRVEIILKIAANVSYSDYIEFQGYESMFFLLARYRRMNRMALSGVFI